MTALRMLPQVEQSTRHICIEGWSQIGRWSGVPLRDFLQRIGADLCAPFVSFKCFDAYSTSIDMASALHPQTILAPGFRWAALAPEWGCSLAAIFNRSARESAFIFRIALPRCAFTVIWLMPSSQTHLPI